jgi:hypothetical protein
VSLAAVLLAAGTTWAVASWASTTTVGASECTSLNGSAKTAALVNLSESSPQAAGVLFTLNATGCTVPRVDAQSTNGAATQALIVGKLSSPSVRCVLSQSDERLWGKLTVKWKNAAGVALLNAAGKPITDQLYVRLDIDGTERYDLHGFATNGPNGGGDASAEIGLQRLAACGSGPTKWTVISDGSIGGASQQHAVSEELIGSDGDSDSFVIERFSTAAAAPTTTTTASASTTTTTAPASHTNITQICNSASTGVAVDVNGETIVLTDATPTLYGQFDFPYAIAGARPGCLSTSWTPPPPEQLQQLLEACLAGTLPSSFCAGPTTYGAAPGYEEKLAAFGSCALVTLSPEELTSCVDEA